MYVCDILQSTCLKHIARLIIFGETYIVEFSSVSVAQSARYTIIFSSVTVATYHWPSQRHMVTTVQIISQSCTSKLQKVCMHSTCSIVLNVFTNRQAAHATPVCVLQQKQTLQAASDTYSSSLPLMIN